MGQRIERLRPLVPGVDVGSTRFDEPPARAGRFGRKVSETPFALENDDFWRRAARAVSMRSAATT